MADWVWVWRIGLGKREKELPLLSAAIHFHYGTPLKVATHNLKWNLIREKIASIHQPRYSKLPAMSTLGTQCTRRCKSLTVWFMLMHLPCYCCPSIQLYHIASPLASFWKAFSICKCYIKWIPCVGSRQPHSFFFFFCGNQRFQAD